jgi:hypothetical protein
MDRLMAAIDTASHTAMRAARRLLRSELTRLQEVDASRADRLARVEIELRAVQQAQGRRLETLEGEVRRLGQRLSDIEKRQVDRAP